MIEKKYNFCPHCGRKLPRLNADKINYCSFCGAKLKNQKPKVTCTVCHEHIYQEKSKGIKCSFCGSEYHPTCVSSWLLKYNACPMCQNVFTFPNKNLHVIK